MTARVSAASADVVGAAAADGQDAARRHGALPPTAGDGSGDRIATAVALPPAAVAVDGDPFRGSIVIETIRWRSRAWRAAAHRVAVRPGDRFAPPVAASPWAPGEWGGSSVVSDAFADALPPEASP